jgi:hypothetical protein
MKQLYLAAKPSHVGVDMDGLACPLHDLRLVAVRRGDIAYLSGIVLSYHCSRQWRLSRDVKLPERRYLMES